MENKDTKKVLVVVDMQKDFIDGALGTKEAVAIVDNVAETIKSFDGEVVFTRDTHFDNYMETQEGRNLPVPHCIKDTEGWQLDKKLEVLRTADMKAFDKLTFGSVGLAEYLKSLKSLESVTLIGLCTDICVISNALLIKANLPEVKISVIEKCCAGVTPESHKNAIEAMKMCQIAIA
jgi:nicotinamidase-related amidase